MLDQMLAPMITYGLNNEDAVLRRAFEGEKAPLTYVDVGAAYPTIHSLTRHMYDGRGINIEPNPGPFSWLEAARPEDINLNCAVAGQIGRVSLNIPQGPDWGLATADPEVATIHRRAGRASQDIEVPSLPLDDILEEHHGDTEIGFLKVDVEGLEEEVLRSVDLNYWLPRLIVVEATQPTTTESSHQQWEPVITAAGYACTLFDGLNRYYVHRDYPQLAERVKTGASPFDNYCSFEMWHALSPALQDEIIARETAKKRDMTAFYHYQVQRDQIQQEVVHAGIPPGPLFI